MKEFLPYETVRNDALKLASKIYHDGFVPDIIYSSLRGGAYMANVISEYFKLALKDRKPVLYAAVVARSYSDIHSHDAIRIDGWTYSPDYLRQGDKILLIDDIYDSGRTLNYLVQVFLEKGVPREDIRADYMATNIYLERDIVELSRMLHLKLGLEPGSADAAMRCHFGAREDYIDALYDEAERRWGSMQGFIESGLGVTSEERSLLRRYYIKP